MVGKLLFIVGRVAGLSAEVLEELHAREADADQDSGHLRRRAAAPGRIVIMAVATAPARTITAEEQAIAQTLRRARARAMRAVDTYDQAAVDRLCRAVAWAGGNEADRDQARADERGRKRHGQPRTEAPRQGARHPARRAAAEEHRGSSKRFPRRGSSSTRSRPA